MIFTSRTSINIPTNYVIILVGNVISHKDLFIELSQNLKGGIILNYNKCKLSKLLGFSDIKDSNKILNNLRSDLLEKVNSNHSLIINCDKFELKFLLSEIKSCGIINTLVIEFDLSYYEELLKLRFKGIIDDTITKIDNDSVIDCKILTKLNAKNLPVINIENTDKFGIIKELL